MSGKEVEELPGIPPGQGGSGEARFTNTANNKESPPSLSK